jgi:copper(I)-binding protein
MPDRPDQGRAPIDKSTTDDLSAYNPGLLMLTFEVFMLKRLLRVLVMLLSTGLIAGAAGAHGTHAGNIHVEKAQARASVGNQANGAVFLVIENVGKTDDALLSALAHVSSKIEIHSMTMDGDVMKMRTVERLDLKASEKIEMKPGHGYHLMLMGLKKPLKAGDTFPMQLTFRKAGKVQIRVTVAEMGGESKANGGDEMHHHHHHQ